MYADRAKRISNTLCVCVCVQTRTYRLIIRLIALSTLFADVQHRRREIRQIERDGAVSPVGWTRQEFSVCHRSTKRPSTRAQYCPLNFIFLIHFLVTFAYANEVIMPPCVCTKVGNTLRTNVTDRVREKICLFSSTDFKVNINVNGIYKWAQFVLQSSFSRC